MYLTHRTDPSTKNIYNILKDGYLRPSTKTKNYALFGALSPHIFLTLNDKNDKTPHMYLDIKLLCENVFYLNYGWHGDPEGARIDGRKISLNEIKNIISAYRKKVKEIIKKAGDATMFMMSHEILLKRDIDLVKYLKKIKDINLDEKTKLLLKKKYPKVKIIPIKNTQKPN